MTVTAGKVDHAALEKDDAAFWYKDAVIYQLHVRAFMDSNGDGIGDFGGLTEKLDYLQDLGVTALWLLPFSPSPLRDDGYDTSDYKDVHASYGTLRDFRRFLREAHRRGLRVITELVVNHTSDQHPWFQRARRARPGSRERDFYVWSDDPKRYSEARIIFKDFETSNWAWDPVANAYYWHRFYSHQPDLNYENPEVRKAVKKVLDFWFDMGVDGLRLDAVPYLYEREGTNCENLPETHAILKELRRHVDAKHSNRMLLAEANQWPEDAVAYFGDGDECHMAFQFPVMPRLFMASRLEQRYPIVEILQQTPTIPDNCQWAVFLRNHDELTLEMVTDEERDYMYRMFAQDPRMRINLGIRRRLAPLLGNNRRKIELLNGLLFSMPGTPIIYYGDEIGMGDNIYLGDRNGVRTPMQWSADRNAGFSRANPQQLYLPVIIDPEFQYEAINVEAQRNNPSSLLWWMKRLIALRKRYKAFGRGSLEFLEPENHKVVAFRRRYEDQTLLVVANLSRFTQCVELDLHADRDAVPIELFGGTRFPRIGELPYFLTVAPHMFHWFALEKDSERLEIRERPDETPEVSVPGAWHEVFETRGSEPSRLEEALQRYLPHQRWFAGKAHGIRAVRIPEVFTVTEQSRLALVEVEYQDAEPEMYSLPLSYGSDDGSEASQRHVVARVRSDAAHNGARGVLRDATHDPDFQVALFDLIRSRRKLAGSVDRLVGIRVSKALRNESIDELQPHLMHAEQSNSSIRYGDRWVLKLYRKLQPGESQDVEISRFLGRDPAFPHVPLLAGHAALRTAKGDTTLAALQAYVHNEGDAWSYTLDALERFLERVLALPADAKEPPDAPPGRDEHDAREEALDRIGTYGQSARMLGERTAQLHARLAADPGDAAFAPEPFTSMYQRSMYQSMTDLTRRVLRLLERRRAHLPEAYRDAASAVLDQRDALLGRFEVLKKRRIDAMRIRCHGDYHLGQVLYTGKDFVIIDFEGEPAASLTSRRLKRSPLRDVAGMLRSFHYAAHTGLVHRPVQDGLHSTIAPDANAWLERWATYWSAWIETIYLERYLETLRDTDLVPADAADRAALLDVHLLEKAIYELGYELNNRPDWVGTPVRGILRQMEREHTHPRATASDPAPDSTEVESDDEA